MRIKLSINSYRCKQSCQSYQRHPGYSSVDLPPYPPQWDIQSDLLSYDFNMLCVFVCISIAECPIYGKSGGHPPLY